MVEEQFIDEAKNISDDTWKKAKKILNKSKKEKNVITPSPQLQKLAKNKKIVCLIDAYAGMHGKVVFKNHVKYLPGTDQWEIGDIGKEAKTYDHDGMRLDTSIWCAMNKGGLFLDA